MKTAKYLSIFVLGIVFLVYSCKKEKEEPPITTPVSCNSNYKLHKGEISSCQNSTVISSDSNVYICGKIIDVVSLLKLDINGNFIWRKETDIFGEEIHPSSIAISDNNEIIICGNYYEGNDIPNNYDIIVMKLTSNGDLIWQKRFGGSGNEYAYNIIRTYDNCFLVCGRFNGNSSIGYDLLLYKINTNGDTVWTRKYHDSNVSMYPQSLIELSDNGFLVLSTYPKEIPEYESLILKYSETGNLEWQSNCYQNFYCATRSNDGNILLCGDNASINESLYIKKITNFNDVIWGGTVFESSIYTRGKYIKESPNGTINIIVDVRDIYDNYYSKLYRYNQNRQKLPVSPTIDGLPFIINNQANGNSIITGFINCNSNRWVFFAKTDTSGNYINLN